MPPSWPSSPLHQAVERLHRALPLLRRQRADGVDHRRHHGGEAVEGAEQAEEDQEVDDVAGEVALLLDAGRHGSPGSSGSRPRSASAAPAGRRACAASGASSRGALVNSCPGRSSAKPSIQLTEAISVRTCQKQASTPMMKTEQDEDLQVRRGEEDLLHRREDQHRHRGGQPKHDQHHDDLPHRLGELRFGPVTEHHLRQFSPRARAPRDLTPGRTAFQPACVAAQSGRKRGDSTAAAAPLPTGAEERPHAGLRRSRNRDPDLRDHPDLHHGEVGAPGRELDGGALRPLHPHARPRPALPGAADGPGRQEDQHDGDRARHRGAGGHHQGQRHGGGRRHRLLPGGRRRQGRLRGAQPRAGAEEHQPDQHPRGARLDGPRRGAVQSRCDQHRLLVGDRPRLVALGGEGDAGRDPRPRAAAGHQRGDGRGR